MGTRALTFIKPFNRWIVTQFDGYPEGLGKNLKYACEKYKDDKVGFLDYINRKHENRGCGISEVEALGDYFGDKDMKKMQESKNCWIEYQWIISKKFTVRRNYNWKIKHDANVGEGEK